MRKNINHMELLAFLPPPPQVEQKKKKKTRGPTRKHIPQNQRDSYLFVDVDESHVEEVKGCESKTVEPDFTATTGFFEFLTPNGDSGKPTQTPSIKADLLNRNVLMRLNMNAVYKEYYVPQCIHAKSQDVYPDSVDFACWNCCHKYKTRPIGIPLKYIKSTNQFVCQGYYCGIACIASALDKHPSKRVKMFSGSLLAKMRHSLYGTPMSDAIPRAPSIYVLKMFGGPMDIERYRKISSSTDIKVETIESSSIYVPMGVNVYEINRKGMISDGKVGRRYVRRPRPNGFVPKPTIYQRNKRIRKHKQEQNSGFKYTNVKKIKKSSFKFMPKTATEYKI